MTKRLIVFDLDGTLIDSAPDLHQALVETFVQINRPPPDLQTTISYVGHGAGMLMRRALKATGGSSKDEEAAALKMFLTAYHRAGVSNTRLYPGVIDTLSDLQRAGAVLAICTNKPQEPAHEVCDALGLTASMALVLGAGTDLPRKPDPAPLLHVADKLTVRRAHTVFVGDSVVDHQTAAAAGISFAFFTGGYINGEIGAPAPALQFEEWGSPVASSLLDLFS
ncbi:MAG: HAD-IA family hydrolase [Pseudomonadota bacterium]